MKYLLFITIFFSLHLTYAMESEIAPIKYVKEFDETIGKVLAKEKGIDEEGKKQIHWYRSTLQGNLGSHCNRLKSIRDKYISPVNVLEYNKEAAELIKLWFNEKRIPKYVYKDKLYGKAFYSHFACEAGNLELVSFFLDKIKVTKEKWCRLFFTAIEGCFSEIYNLEQKISEKKLVEENAQKIKKTIRVRYFTLCKNLRDAGISLLDDYKYNRINFGSPLIRAAVLFNPDFVAFFLAAGLTVNEHVINTFNNEKSKELKNNYKGEIEQIENLFNRSIAWNNFLKHPDHKQKYWFYLLPHELLALFERKFLYGVEI